MELEFPPDSEIRNLLIDRIDVQRKSVGMVVGLLTPQGQRIVAYGAPNQGDPRPLNGDTLFEIGSIGKVFTALLLADMVERGEVTLTEPAAKYLPAGVRLPERAGRSITLLDLATHMSGLPMFPANFPAFGDPAVAGYSVEQFYQFLSTYELTRDIGSRWEYSNTGAGLLGHVLARRAGQDYETLIRERITGPLGMTRTAIRLSPQLQTDLAVAHDQRLQITHDLDMPTLAGAGTLRSCANDLLRFLAAALGLASSSLAPALARMLSPRQPTTLANFQQALGWQILELGDGPIITHDGFSVGYAATIAYDPQARTGVVVLSNAAVPVQDIALHLLRPNWPLAKWRQEIAIDPKLLESYAGQYQAASGAIFHIAREGDFLTIQPPGAPKFRLRGESEQDFFVQEVDLQVTFPQDGTGRPNSMIIHFSGKDSPAARISPGA